jgi:hypothetical protein
MARATKINLGEEFALKLDALGKNTDAYAKMALYEGAKVVADAVRSAIDTLPYDKFRHLTPGTPKFTGISNTQREDLKNGLGITPMGLDDKGNYSVKVAITGYGSKPTNKYTKGVPNALLARSIESGSSVRGKVPFVRAAAKKAKPAAIAAMENKINSLIIEA